MAKILLINPNSSRNITAAVEKVVAPLGRSLGVEVDCRTLEEGPPGIETQADVESVVIPTATLIARTPADAYVIACFSDPGLDLARELVKPPVLGIAESAFHLATGLGRQFGIIAILDRSIPRHLRYVRSLGLESRLAGDRAINVGVAGLGDRDRVLGRMLAVGEALRDEDGADTVILGCAGMGHYRQELEERLALPVIDPSQAAVARAASLVALGLGGTARR